MVIELPKIELPKIGDKIPVEKFFVSKCNVRADEEFGDTNPDELLTAHFSHSDIVQPFTARPEGDGFGVFIGRRRFLGKKRSGAKFFVVGKDCLIKEMSDEEALDSSLRENLQVFQEDLNPISRAIALSKILSRKTTGLRGLARTWKIQASTLSEWLKVLELSPKMQDALAKGLLLYSDARQILRMGLGNELQDKLAEILETDGLEAFKNELARIPTGKMKRGIPKDVYFILRTTFDRRYKPDLELWEKIQKRAKQKNMKEDQYIKWFLRENL